MKIHYQGRVYAIQDPKSPQTILLPISISAPNQNHWAKAEALVDTGSTHLVLPRKIIDALGFDLPQAGAAQMLDANGVATETETVLVDLALKTVPDGKTVIFAQVPCIISENGPAALIGGMVLGEMDILVKRGKMALLRLSSEKL